jgi:CheY-like chemotaxis protein
MGHAGPKAVLIADDDCSVRRVLAEFMASRGYSVVEAEDGVEAWEKLRDTHTDIVVSDLQMPQCDGRELCRRIRAEPTMRHVRVVIITGGELPERRQLDCDAVLPKPIFVHALLEELERVSSATVEA